MFLDCPAYLDDEGAVRCGLPAEVRSRFMMRSTDGPLESAMIRCPVGHWFNAPTGRRRASRERVPVLRVPGAGPATDRRAAAAAAVAVEPGGDLGDAAHQRVLVRGLPRGPRAAAGGVLRRLPVRGELGDAGAGVPAATGAPGRADGAALLR